MMTSWYDELRELKFSSLTLFFISMIVCAFAVPPTEFSVTVIVIHGVLVLIMRHVARTEGRLAERLIGHQ
jgi:apolipoprotein N-acyltransferase